MKVVVHLYGPLAAAIAEKIAVDVKHDCATVATVRRDLVRTYPDLADLIIDERTRCFIDNRMVADDYTIENGQTLELLPPVSGG